MPRKADSKTSAHKRGTIVGRVEPADPVELIRWLALSRLDPRKALAELMQCARTD